MVTKIFFSTTTDDEEGESERAVRFTTCISFGMKTLIFIILNFFSAFTIYLNEKSIMNTTWFSVIVILQIFFASLSNGYTSAATDDLLRGKSLNYIRSRRAGKSIAKIFNF